MAAVETLELPSVGTAKFGVARTEVPVNPVAPGEFGPTPAR